MAQVGWGQDRRHIAVMITDADFHSAGDGLLLVSAVMSVECRKNG
jgi:hypothetical protein